MMSSNEQKFHYEMPADDDEEQFSDEVNNRDAVGDAEDNEA